MTYLCVLCFTTTNVFIFIFFFIFIFIFIFGSPKMLYFMGFSGNGGGHEVEWRGT